MSLPNRLAADIGGTFTDIAFFDGESGKMRLGKTLSTPKKMVDGIATAVAKADTQFKDSELFLHGSTVAINTLLERKGAKTALLITEGFRDIYEIGRINRPDAYNLFFKKHVPLVERALRYEVRERLTVEGDVHIALDIEGVHQICDKLVANSIEAVAILLLHCYANSAHELEVKRIVQERLPEAFVSASHELSREYREFERCSTTVANAYVGPIMSRYVAEIDERLRGSGFGGAFLLVQSTGGLYESAQAKLQCVKMLESGPAAGVVGAHALCRELGLSGAIAFDMGGTTAKAGVIHEGQILTTSTAMVGGYAQGLPIQIPLIDVFEVGTGGGSIAEVDDSGALRVGPRSAGAEPGPACYGKGGKMPTITDANLVLGRIAADRFLGGEMKLDYDAAYRAIEDNIAKKLGLDVVSAAAGILKVAATKMSYAVKGVSTDRGLDAAAFTLIAYGGAGPLHAAEIAREIGTSEIIIPLAPGHFCAFGMLHSDLRYDTVRTTFHKLDDIEFTEIDRIFGELVASGKQSLMESGVQTAKVEITFAVDMRYVGQEHAVTVDLSPSLLGLKDRAAIKKQFDAVHQQRYGTCAPSESGEIVTLRASVAGVMAKPALEEIAKGAAQPPAEAKRGTRDVFFYGASGMQPASVFFRDHLLAGNRITGPALIEEYASTTVLLPGDQLEVDVFGNLRIELGE